MHGSMDRESGFARLVKHLRPHGEVVTYDRQGYSRSLNAPGDRSISAHMEDLRTVIGPVPSIVVGHSLGGAIALGLAAESPGLVRGLVVYESPMSWESWWSKDGGGSVAARATTPEDAAEAFMRRFVGRERWERLPQRTKDSRRAEGVALRAESMSLRRGAPWKGTRIECPVMSGCGEASRDDFRRSARIVSELSTDGRMVVLPRAHHNAHSASADDFYALLVLPLIRRLESGAWDLVVSVEPD
ncbi:MAG: alpha/beta fold hydrolase [Actinomycetes bacterium]